MGADDLKKLQTKRLTHIVGYCYGHSPFYKKKFDEAGVKPADISSIDDITTLPFTVKDDLRDSYPFGLFHTPLADVVEVHASSGTTGKPTVVGYTENDIELWKEVMARCMATAGTEKGDIVQNAYGYGLFTGGLGVHYGSLALGCTVIPISGGNTEKQLLLMRDFGSTVITCTPSYAVYMAEEAPGLGYDPKAMKLKVGILGAEPWSDKLRAKIEDLWDIAALDIYGLSEIIGPGVAQECEHKDGLHVWSDHFYPEIIDPDTGEQCAEGEKGELVITTFTKEALPLIRYRTRDITTLVSEKCNCGRTMPRVKKFSGRADDMLIIRGVNVFPSQIEHVLMKIPGVGAHYLLVVDREGAMDRLTVQVEVTEETFSDKVADLQKLEKEISHHIKSMIGISAKIELVEPGTIPRSMGKAKRVEDRREGKM